MGKRWLAARALLERVRGNLFFLPAIFVVGSVVFSQAMVSIDERLEPGDLPGAFDSTVSSARAILAAIAGGTITAASIVFSLTLVAVQLASSQFSPRSLGTFLGDRFQQMVIGVVLGTFTYSLLVLRVVRAPLEEGGSPLLPRLSVAVAVVFGLAALIAVIASINHTAQNLRVESVANRITDATLKAIKDRFCADDLGPDHDPPVVSQIGEEGSDRDLRKDALVFRAPRRGWIQQLSARGFFRALPEDSTALIVSPVGSYVLEGEPVAFISPVPEETRDIEVALSRAVVIGPRRTLQEDVAFGVVQLVDIAGRALSPGVNDPNTALELLRRLEAVLAELLARDLTPQSMSSEGRTLIRPQELTHRDYFVLAIEPIRRFARADPQVLAGVLWTLAGIRDEAERRRNDPDLEPVLEQAELLLEELDELATAADRELVLEAARAAGFLAADGA